MTITTPADVVVVTRHPALVQYLVEQGVIGPAVPVMEHATADDVRGRDVVGVLPLHLAAVARTVAEVPLRLAPEDRGRELSLARVREVAEPLRRYVVVPDTDWLPVEWHLQSDGYSGMETLPDIVAGALRVYPAD